VLTIYDFTKRSRLSFHGSSWHVDARHVDEFTTLEILNPIVEVVTRSGWSFAPVVFWL
jgi:hypothetical protein